MLPTPVYPHRQAEKRERLCHDPKPEALVIPPRAVPLLDAAATAVAAEVERGRAALSHLPAAPKRARNDCESGVTSEAMLEQLTSRLASERYQSTMQLQRARLPAAAMAAKVVDAVAANQVVVISGETGCGKTTQVPQFILDATIHAGRGAECRLICTQPRRISAVAVAERVASERLERVGGTVGYQIRLESRMSANTRLSFCTTGRSYPAVRALPHCDEA